MHATQEEVDYFHRLSALLKRISMKNPFLLSLAIVSFLLAPSCRKDDGVNQNLTSGGQVTYDFMSTKNGSEWTYGSRAGVEYTRYARDRDTVKDSLKYSYFERQEKGTGSFTPEYFGKNGSRYITLLDIDGSATTYIPYVFWIDGAGTGTKWDNTGSVAIPGGGSTQAVIESEQVETGGSMMVAGQTFTNVVHVESKLKATAAGIPVGSVKTWFVKDFGVLREEASINILGVYKNEHVDSLLRYTIAP